MSFYAPLSTAIYTANKSQIRRSYMKNLAKRLSFILAVCMLLAALAACQHTAQQCNYKCDY